MISDNYVTGDNIYLRELQNFFFEVLGMMSITHYGAIGDGRRDNYGPLQVAIDDAHRRGLSFLYVPFGRYIYTGELINYLDPETHEPTIIFIGNPHAHIVNIRTGEEIEIKQFGFYKVDIGDEYYTKEEVDALLANIDLSDYYTKTEVDGLLANYYTKSATDTLLSGKQNTLTAGDNITIVDNVISAYGGGGGEGTAFFTDVFPTSWSGTSTSASGTNTYGTWNISTDGTPYDSNIGDTFDGDLSTGVVLNTTEDGRYNIEIDLPSGTSIKPTHLKLGYTGIWYDADNDPIVFQGYASGAWTTLKTINAVGHSDSYSIDANISPNAYFTKFRLHNIRNNAGYGVGNRIREIQITSGYIRTN